MSSAIGTITVLTTLLLNILHSPFQIRPDLSEAPESFRPGTPLILPENMVKWIQQGLDQQDKARRVAAGIIGPRIIPNPTKLHGNQLSEKYDALQDLNRAYKATEQMWRTFERKLPENEPQAREILYSKWLPQAIQTARKYHNLLQKQNFSLDTDGISPKEQALMSLKLVADLGLSYNLNLLHHPELSPRTTKEKERVEKFFSALIQITQGIDTDYLQQTSWNGHRLNLPIILYYWYDVRSSNKIMIGNPIADDFGKEGFAYEEAIERNLSLLELILENTPNLPPSTITKLGKHPLLNAIVQTMLDPDQQNNRDTQTAIDNLLIKPLAAAYLRAYNPSIPNGGQSALAIKLLANELDPSGKLYDRIFKRVKWTLQQLITEASSIKQDDSAFEKLFLTPSPAPLVGILPSNKPVLRENLFIGYPLPPWIALLTQQHIREIGNSRYFYLTPDLLQAIFSEQYQASQGITEQITSTLGFKEPSATYAWADGLYRATLHRLENDSSKNRQEEIAKLRALWQDYLKYRQFMQLLDPKHNTTNYPLSGEQLQEFYKMPRRLSQHPLTKLLNEIARYYNVFSPKNIK